MLDKSLPYTPLMMTKTDTENFPKFDLPEGYSFRFYRAGDEMHWAALECALGQFETVEATRYGGKVLCKERNIKEMTENGYLAYRLKEENKTFA